MDVRPTGASPLNTIPSSTRPTTPRQVADAYVEAVSDLDPIVATSLGNRPGDDRLPDYSPAGLEAEDHVLDKALGVPVGAHRLLEDEVAQPHRSAVNPASLGAEDGLPLAVDTVDEAA